MMNNINLRHGDCLELMKDIPDKSIDMILCDLPYGATACKWDTIIPLDQLWEQYNRIIKQGGAIVLFGSEPFSSRVRLSNIQNYKYDWIWNKKLAGNAPLAKKQPLKIHENIMVFNANVYYPQKTTGKLRTKMTGGMSLRNTDIYRHSKTTQAEYKNDTYYPTSIQEFTAANLRKNRLHPSQKPIAVLEYLIKTYTCENETVLDNCMGSGSSGVACRNLNRKFIGIERDAHYFEIAKHRIETEL